METEVYADKAGFWRWRRRAANGKIVASSGESFSSKWAALNSVPTEFEDTEVVVIPEPEDVVYEDNGPDDAQTPDLADDRL